MSQWGRCQEEVDKVAQPGQAGQGLTYLDKEHGLYSEDTGKAETGQLCNQMHISEDEG